MNLGSIGLGAINNAAIGAQTASKNIQNAETEGYAREVVTYTSGPSGTVQVSVERVSDNYVNAQYRNANSSHSQYSVLDKYASQVDEIVTSVGVDDDGEYSSVISSAYNQLYKSMISLSSDDTDTNRMNFLSSLSSFKDIFAEMNKSLDNQNAAINSDITTQVKAANEALNELSSINKKIQSSGSSVDNSLLNKRDQLLDDISGVISIKTDYSDDGSVRVRTAQGQDLLNGGQVKEINASYDEGLDRYSYSVGNVNVSSEALGGSIQGLEAAKVDIVGFAKEGLGSTFYVLASAINSANAKGYSSPGGAGGDLIDLPQLNVSSSASNSGSGSLMIDSVDWSGDMPNRYEVEIVDGGVQVTNLENDSVTTYDGFPITVGSVTLSEAGSAQVGDKFNVSPLGSIAAQSDVSEDTADIAISSEGTALSGDNGNSQPLLHAISGDVALSGSTSVGGLIDSTLATIGAKSDSSSFTLSSYSNTLEFSQKSRDQISGVSLNEENVSLVQYQSAYSAASKIVAAHSKLIDTLLGVV